MISRKAPNQMSCSDISFNAHKNLENYLKAVANMQPVGLVSLVVERGRKYESAKRPRGMRLAKRGECFKNAFHLAHASEGQLAYVEGFACHLIPTLHAWCVDKDGTVIDNTWKECNISAYYGIAFDIDWVCARIVEQNVYGILGSMKLAHGIHFSEDNAYAHAGWSKT